MSVLLGEGNDGLLVFLGDVALNVDVALLLEGLSRQNFDQMSLCSFSQIILF